MTRRARWAIAAGSIAAIAAGYLVVMYAAWFYPAAELARRVATPAVMAFLTGCAAIGAAATARVAVRRTLRGGDPLIDFSVGYPIAGTLFFLLGCVSTAAGPMAALLLILAAMGGLALAKGQRERTLQTERATATGAASIAILVVCAALGFAIAVMPAYSLDEVAYHLTIPKIWSLEGRVVDLPLLSLSYFPLGISAADLPALAILGDQGAIASHLLHLVAAAAAVALVHRFVRSRASGDAAWLASIAVATTPVMLVAAGWSWNDWPLIAVTMALVIACDKGDGTAVATAVAAGLLTKYSFAAAAAGPLVAAFVSAPERRWAVAKATLAGGAAGSVFFVRNLIATGNPFAPFFDRAAPQVTEFRHAGWSLETIRLYLFDPGMADESLGVAAASLIVAGALLVPFAQLDRFAKIVLGLEVLAVALLLRAGPSSRILMPSLAVAAAISAVVVHRAAMSSVRRAIALCIVAGSALQLLAAVTMADHLHQPAAIVGARESDVQYMSRYPFYVIAQWVSSKLPERSRILVVGLNRLFWFQRPVRGGANFDGPRISAYLAEGTPDDLRRRLKDDGITHVAVVRSGLEPAKASHREREVRLSPAAARNLTAVLRHSARSIASRPEVGVWELRP